MNQITMVRTLLAFALLTGPAAGAGVPDALRGCARWLVVRIATYESRAVRAAERAGHAEFETAVGSFEALPDDRAKLERALADGRLVGANLFWGRRRADRTEVTERELFWTSRRLGAYCRYLKTVYVTHAYETARSQFRLSARDVDRIEDLLHGYCRLAPTSPFQVGSSASSAASAAPVTRTVHDSDKHL